MVTFKIASVAMLQFPSPSARALVGRSLQYQRFVIDRHKWSSFTREAGDLKTADLKTAYIFYKVNDNMFCGWSSTLNITING